MPGVETVWLKVAPLPVRVVHVPKPGPVALSQLYVGPEDAGVPVVAAAEFVMLTVPPAHTFVPAMVPGLWVVEYTGISTVVLTGDPHPNVAVRLYL